MNTSNMSFQLMENIYHTATAQVIIVAHMLCWFSHINWFYWFLQASCHSKREICLFFSMVFLLVNKEIAIHWSKLTYFLKILYVLKTYIYNTPEYKNLALLDLQYTTWLYLEFSWSHSSILQIIPTFKCVFSQIKWTIECYFTL